MQKDPFIVSVWVSGRPIPADIARDDLERLLDQLRCCKSTAEVPIKGGPKQDAAVFSPLFYTLANHVEQVVSDEDLVPLLADDHPRIRVLGAKAAARRPRLAPVLNLMKEQDQQVLYVANSKGTFYCMTVGEIAEKLAEDYQFLG